MGHERHIVQYLPECAQYDPRLAYRLKPGRCRFANREYDTEIIVNSAGMRDGEVALEVPRIVVTGDSFAMGWGIAQSETLAAQLGEATGERTLNAAEPSYGTVRELLLLREVDLSAAHTLVIQYCENDFIENARFVKAGGRLRTMERAEYEAIVAEHAAATRYWPGKHAARLLPLLARSTWRSLVPAEPDDPRNCDTEARVFANVLALAAPTAQPLRVVVFEAMYTPEQRSCFGRRLAALARRHALPGWVTELQVVEPTEFLAESDYYPLDEHLAASGYRKIAAEIAERLADGPRGARGYGPPDTGGT